MREPAALMVRVSLQGHSNIDAAKAEAGPSSTQDALKTPPAKPAAIPRTIADRTTAGEHSWRVSLLEPAEGKQAY